MKSTIESTKTFKSLCTIGKSLINRRSSRIQIEDAVIQSRIIGYEAWKNQTGLPLKWRDIVKEIVEIEN